MNSNNNEKLTEKEILDNKLVQLEVNTRLFVGNLVWFDKDNPTNYIKIQKVNEKCEELKRLVRDILNMTWISTAQKFKRWTVTATAEMYISIYETAQNSWKTLHWNILYMDLKINGKF